MFHLSIYAFWHSDHWGSVCMLTGRCVTTTATCWSKIKVQRVWLTHKRRALYSGLLLSRMHLATEELKLAQGISLCNKTPALQGKLQKCRDFTASVQQGHECRSKWNAIIDGITIQHFDMVNLHHFHDTLKAADRAGVKSRRPGIKNQVLHGRIRNRHSVFVSRNVWNDGKTYRRFRVSMTCMQTNVSG